MRFLGTPRGRVTARALACAALVPALALAAATGCGGGKKAEGTKPAAWMDTVCGALVDWKNDVTREAAQLGTDVKGVRSVPLLRQRLVRFLDDAIAETDRMVDRIGSAGAPAVDDGEALQRDLKSSLAGARRSLERARDRAAALPNDPRAFKRGADELGNSIAKEFDGVEDSLDSIDEKYDADELVDAYEDAAACDDLH